MPGYIFLGKGSWGLKKRWKQFHSFPPTNVSEASLLGNGFLNSLLWNLVLENVQWSSEINNRGLGM
jgi:hypothetical protein